jgi:2-polyprenyl-6-methoxyphenol hydroxylase-like FAD-dependent oxidoreductase
MTDVEVLVVGAGPAGLALAIDLLRRDVAVRIVSAAPSGFPGSRAKGVQPRTQEVLDDLGVLADVSSHATTYRSGPSPPRRTTPAGSWRATGRRTSSGPTRPENRSASSTVCAGRTSRC